jgi:hypothetical protein
MYAAAEPTIGRRDYPLSAYEVGKAQDAIGNQLGVLNDVGRMTNDPRQDDLAVG